MGIEGNCDFRDCYRQGSSLVIDGSSYSSERVDSDLFADSFELGNLNRTENGHGWGETNTKPDDFCDVTNDLARTGTYGLRFFFNGDGLNQEDGPWAEQRFNLGAQYSDITIEFYVHVPSNYNHSLPGNNKFLAVYGAPYAFGEVAPETRFQVNWSLEQGAGGASDLSVHHLLEGDEQTIVFPTSGQGVIGLADRGNWVKFRFRVKVPAGEGTNDGIMQIWKNDVLISDEQTQNSYGGNPGNYIDQLYIFGWANSGFTADTVLTVDDFRAVSGVLA